MLDFLKEAGHQRTAPAAAAMQGAPVATTALGQGTFPALLADQPHAEHREKLKLFGQFVGSWSFEAVDTPREGVRATASGEMHFHWILEGRAVQDVWRETKRQDSFPKMYGSTVRLYDSKTDMWKVVWIAPEGGIVRFMTGRQVGPEIVMEGEAPDGAPMRWIFSDIGPNSFRWRGERLVGKRWYTYKELLARRKS